MRHRYLHCDVFTDSIFGGNPLAVLPDARGLSDAQMQRIAREFNFSETSFVLPPESGNTRRVRIFTPSIEVPFAGHPNVGTAFALAISGELGPLAGTRTIVFEEKAGLVPITIERRAGGAFFCELSAPEPLSVGRSVAPETLAAAVSLDARDVRTAVHAPAAFSVGLPFLFAELASRGALARARTDPAGVDALVAAGVPADVHLYVRSGDDFDLRTRMFAPKDGVPEDPATGSANVALAAALAHFDARPSGSFRYRIAQGVEMGRPSVLEARAEKKGGAVTEARIGGTSVLVAEGTMEVP
ncbi:MAG TPA: PhzF family phenazine biosynthesis protein [Thermoanaerobaculia bacterium]|nr:PhzF family phenazine biosynthesis protein [Thermoanaerobaculia bacterium]